jgi:hypothetical protein
MFTLVKVPRISAFRATVISLTNVGTRAAFALLGPLVGYGIDAWGLPSVLSALGIVFSIVFVVLVLPLVLREVIAIYEALRGGRSCPAPRARDR